MDDSVRINYLNNKDILAEINKSKLSYCEFYEENSSDYDAIVDLPKPTVKGGKVKIDPPTSPKYKESLENRRALCMSDSVIEAAKISRANKISQLLHKRAMVAGGASGLPPNKNDFTISTDDVNLEDLVIRFHTFEHIPISNEHKEKRSTEADYREKVNFVPFIHYKYNLKDGIIVGLREVGRSHHKNGEFNISHGSITGKLAHMFVLLTDKSAQKHNWRGYTYVDDMKGSALLQFSSVGLQFNEARSENPFAYLTTVLTNAFLRVLLAEKKQQDIRDDLIEQSGDTPSIGRQLDRDDDQRQERDRILKELGDFDIE